MGNRELFKKKVIQQMLAEYLLRARCYPKYWETGNATMDKPDKISVLMDVSSGGLETPTKTGKHLEKPEDRWRESCEKRTRDGSGQADRRGRDR